MGEKIKVLIVDDHPVFRFGLRSLLEQDAEICVVGEAENAANARLLIEDERPDILLLDIRMEGQSGIQLAQQLSKVASGLKIIILTAFENEDYLVEAMAAGVYAYLYKNSSSEILSPAIHLVHSGQKLLDPNQINLVLKKLQDQTKNQKKEKYHLTEMEVNLLRSIAEGKTYEEIGKTFFLSEPTVKRMIAGILGKIGANNRAQAVALAIQDGII